MWVQEVESERTGWIQEPCGHLSHDGVPCNPLYLPWQLAFSFAFRSYTIRSQGFGYVLSQLLDTSEQLCCYVSVGLVLCAEPVVGHL